MNDRQRVEALIFTTIFLNVLDCGVDDPNSDEARKCRAYLVEAREEVLRGMDERRRAAILRRTTRLHDAVMDPHRKEGMRVDKAGMIAYYALQAVLESGYLELCEGTKLAVALNAIVEGLADGFAEDRLDSSAQKQAMKMLRHMQMDGYFDGVEFRKESAEMDQLEKTQ